MIVGHRVRLRSAGTAAGDHESIVAWRNDDAIRPWFFSQSVLTLESHLAWFRRASTDPEQMYLAIDALLEPASAHVLATPLLIGTVGLVGIDATHSEAEFGRLMIGARTYRGRGYAKEAAFLVADHAFANLGLRRLRAEVLADNRTALALYSALGFVADDTAAERSHSELKSNSIVTLLLAAEEFRRRQGQIREALGLPARTI